MRGAEGAGLREQPDRAFSLAGHGATNGLHWTPWTARTGLKICAKEAGIWRRRGDDDAFCFRAVAWTGLGGLNGPRTRPLPPGRIC